MVTTTLPSLLLLALVAAVACSSSSSNDTCDTSGLQPAILEVLSAGSASPACNATFQISDPTGAAIAPVSCTGSVPPAPPNDAGTSCSYPVCLPHAGGPYTVLVSQPGYGSVSVAGLHAGSDSRCPPQTDESIASVTLEPIVE